MRTNWGTLVLVVGPSGAGKDSIIRGAQLTLAGDSRFVFPRRAITREADLAAEDHDCVTDMGYALAVANGDFAVWWRAHGNGYGIPVSIDDDLRLGRTVVFNCSRAIVGEVQKQYQRIIIANVEVSPDVLLERIVRRGRENREQAIERVKRAVPPLPAGTIVHAIRNDGPLDAAVSAFCNLLSKLDNAAPDPGRGALDKQNQNEDSDDGSGRLIIVK
jgi:phosphonate metabolism protein PhnN/1,5-bisphosphokinase (PRPP-forming)